MSIFRPCENLFIPIRTIDRGRVFPIEKIGGNRADEPDMNRELFHFNRVSAYYVALIYATISLAYILISDILLIGLNPDDSENLLISLGKGFAFVILTSILLYLLIRRSDRRRLQLQNRIYDLNEMMNQKEIVSQVVRLESIGRLAAGMAHNLNNIMAIIEGNADMIAGKCSGDDTSKNLQAIRNSVARARGLSDTLLSFSEGGEPVKELIDLGRFVAEVSTAQLEGSKVRLSLDIPASLSTVLADRGQLRHAYENLLINSLEVMPGGGTISITGRNVRLGEKEVADLVAGEYIRIEIRDSGPGIPDEVLESIFDPYFSTKGQNRGLGLTLAQSVVRRHGGVVLADSPRGQGARFTVYHPVHRYVPDQRVAIERGEMRTGRILWMDDEQGIREVGKELLEHLGYEAVTASDGQEALEMYREALGSRPFDAVVLDLVVPKGMGGAETMERLLDMDPKVRAVVCSGYSKDPIMASHLEHGFMAVLPKPFLIGSLKKVLDDMLE